MRRDLTRDQRFSARALEMFQAGPTDGLRVVAATETAPAEILIYDVIGEDFWGEGVTAKGVVAALADAGSGPVKVRVNSPGGDVFEGLAIYHALQQHSAGVDVVVDGLAASAASYIAMAGRTVTMQDAAMMMIHNARSLAYGDKIAMRGRADVMDKIDGQLAGIYAAKTGKDSSEIAGLMDAETWMTAAEAKAAGFCDTVAPAPKKVKAQAEPVTPPPPADTEPPASPPGLDARKRRLALAERQ